MDHIADRIRNYHHTCILSKQDIHIHQGYLDTPERRDYTLYLKKYQTIQCPFPQFISYVASDMEHYAMIINNYALFVYRQILILELPDLKDEAYDIQKTMINIVEEEIIRRFLHAFPDAPYDHSTFHIGYIVYALYQRDHGKSASKHLTDLCRYYQEMEAPSAYLSSFYKLLCDSDHEYYLAIRQVIKERIIRRCGKLLHFYFPNEDTLSFWEDMLSKIYHRSQEMY